MTKRSTAAVIALAVFLVALVVARALAVRAQERELAAERARARAVGTPYLLRLAERVGHLAATAGALAAGGDAAELPEGQQVSLLDGDGRTMGRNVRSVVLPAPVWSQVAGADSARAPAVFGPVAGPDGAPAMVALAMLGPAGSRREARWLALSADLTALAAPAGLEGLLAAGYDYDLLVADSAAAPRRGLRGAPATMADAVHLPLHIGPGVLELALLPRGGWSARTGPDIPMIFGFLLCVLLAVAAYEILRLPHREREEAAARLGQLESANRRLLGTLQGLQERDRRLQAERAHDAVTGLPSRAHLLDRIDRALGRVRAAPDTGFGLLCVGLEGLPYVTDSFGADAGDRLLSAVARRLDQAKRPGDLVARVAADAFGVVLTDVTTPESAVAAARRIRAALDAKVALNDREVPVSAWIGIEMSRTGYERPEEMLQHATVAMERAKIDGVEGTALFDPTQREQAARRFQLESDLRLALEREEFRVAYQIVVALDTGATQGAEALIRWVHPLEGMIPPLQFIGVAEDTGLIVPITRWVLREVCRQLERWRDTMGPEFYVSVNLSARDLQDSSLCDYLSALMQEYRIAPGTLRVEVTEGMLMADVHTATEILEELRRLRIPVLLDDFGTGYSSLSYLHRFRFDILKIDRAFVRDIVTNARTRNITRTIVHLAANLEMRTVAEGIDDPAQIEVLRELGCDFGQGYHYGKPADASQIVARSQVSA